MRDAKKTGRQIAAVAALSALVSLGGCKGADAPGMNGKINVFAAASLTDVCGELERVYEDAHPGTDIIFSFGSSGALRSQIEEGAKADVFISAAKDHMDTLVEERLVRADTVCDLLENEIVLIVPEKNPANIRSFQDLTSDKVSLIGIGDPESVPAGKYAKQVLTSLGIYDRISARLNFGTDVRNVLAWNETGETDCGIVYATDARTTDKVTVVASAPAGSLEKVIYPVAVTTDADHAELANDFENFLRTERALAEFEKYGFSRIK